MKKLLAVMLSVTLILAVFAGCSAKSSTAAVRVASKDFTENEIVAEVYALALEDAGIIQKDELAVKPYSNEWHLHHSDEWFLFYVQAYCKKITPKAMRPGDFLLYQYGRCISHAAVYCGNDTVCHALVKHGVILSDINDVMFFDAHGNSRLRGVYRFNGGV